MPKLTASKPSVIRTLAPKLFTLKTIVFLPFEEKSTRRIKCTACSYSRLALMRIKKTSSRIFTTALPSLVFKLKIYFFSPDVCVCVFTETLWVRTALNGAHYYIPVIINKNKTVPNYSIKQKT